MNNPKFIDETGNKYGKLTVIKRAQNTIYGTAKWLCQCECGNTKEYRGQDLRRGEITHCGCEIKPKGITNYFKIKNMSINEMAEYLCKLMSLAECEICSKRIAFNEKFLRCNGKTEKDCIEGIGQWLLQEVEE